MSRIALLIISAMVLVIGVASAKIFEENAQTVERATLSTLAPLLDVAGIDTAYCCSTDHPIERGRPRLAPLVDFKPHEKSWGATEADAWAIGFGDGMRGMIFAVKTNNPAQTKIADVNISCLRQLARFSQDLCKFVTRWVSIPPVQRVFIAFTKSDYDHALRVKEALERDGYIAFMFLQSKDAPPWADPSLVGELFTQSGLRLVIDSNNSRGSEGVRYESLCCSLLLDHTRPSANPSEATVALTQLRSN